MADAKNKKSGAMAMLIVVALLLTLVGAGTGFAVGTLLQKDYWDPSKAAQAAAAVAAKTTLADAPQNVEAASGGAGDSKGDPGASQSADGEANAIDPRSLKVVAFPPVLTTLAEPKGKWIRLEGSILMTGTGSDSPEVLAERSGEQILTYLRTLRLDQLEGPAGVLSLRADLNEMVRTLSQGQVQGVLIHGLVIE